MKDRAKRVIAACRHIATMSEEPGRITRRFLTPPVCEVHAYLRLEMEALGMAVYADAAGNLRGLWKPASAGQRRLIIGSHIDTVPDAGAFDGILGVTMALEWVRLAGEIAFPVPIEVIAFSEEEGVRFGVPFIGSRAVAGRFDPSLLALKDGEGISLAEAIRRFGLDPAKIPKAEVNQEGAAFVEIHIEQGPVLETEHLSVGVVTGIVGQTRLSLEFSGHANHAGTTPMHLRRDALAAAAEWIVFVEAFARGTDGLVATVGKWALEPNASNVIPGKARVSLDVRHAHDSQRNSAVEELIAKARAIAERRSLAFDCTPLMNEPAVSMDERLTAYLAAAVEAADLPLKEMPSGAGHDAMVMATRMPTAMLFLRSPGGISHHPDETVTEEDVEAALQVGRKFLERLASDWQA
ncbi:MAG TPA: allantoate amidohydrolase [Terracidiphilus sp.]|nr:allantoate amidohydrolase [Terracidiphilus sp.]